MLVNTDILRVRSTPEIKPDNIVDRLHNGQEVSVINRQGDWSQISYANGKTGWVSSAYLKEGSSTTVTPPVPSNGIPIFKIGVPNLAHDINTINVRKIIHDVFGGGVRGDVLQCTEYVQYRVAQNGIVIQWPVTSGRNGGRWAGIFEQYKKYHVLDSPKVGCAVSFIAGFTGAAAVTGHIAYVEEVHPDGSIRVTEANWPGDGKYNDRNVPAANWRDLHKCRFIDFS